MKTFFIDNFSKSQSIRSIRISIHSDPSSSFAQKEHSKLQSFVQLSTIFSLYHLNSTSAHFLNYLKSHFVHISTRPLRSIRSSMTRNYPKDFLPKISSDLSHRSTSHPKTHFHSQIHRILYVRSLTLYSLFDDQKRYVQKCATIRECFSLERHQVSRS